jgi:hypothetical protein
MYENAKPTQQLAYDVVTKEWLPAPRLRVGADGTLDVEIFNDRTVYATSDIDEASATVTYIGKMDADGAWMVMKIDTSSGTAFTYATIKNNVTLTTYALGWAGRATNTYGTYQEAF